MITQKMNNALQKISTFGAEYIFDEKELQEKKFNFKERLRDFTDKEVMEVLQKKPKTVSQLFALLERSVDDKDIKAHIYGFSSDEEIMKEIERLKNGRTN